MAHPRLSFVCSFRLLSNTDCDTVQVVLCERLYAGTLRVVSDAALGDAVLLLQSLHDLVSTLGGETVVDAVVTSAGVSIASDDNFRLGILGHIVGDVLHFLSLRLTDVVLVNQEEYVAADWLNLLNDRSRGRSRLYDRLGFNNRLGLGHWCGRNDLVVGLTQVDAKTSQCVEIPVGLEVECRFKRLL